MKKLGRFALQTLAVVAFASLSHIAMAYPACERAASDPDGDGWGWENNQSCIVQKSSSGGHPACSSAASDPDGDGWGWENNRSCVVQKTSSGGHPACSSAASDPDGDGWGWENNRSCKVTATTTPSSCPARARCGSYVISGLGARKQQMVAAGGNSLDVATAMLESERMLADYIYGDNKVSDAANFGIFKQNWGMLRMVCSRFRGQTVSQWNNGADLNRDLNADIGCLHESQGSYGTEQWFAGHRNGATGLLNPNTEDIKLYRSAVYWIRDQLNAGNMTNDIRFWVDVPPI